MPKALAVSTQLKQSLTTIQELEKKVNSLQQLADNWRAHATKSDEMLEQIHQFLDAVPGSIARESEGANSWDRVKRTPITRLAAWLSSYGN